jgi:enoyl-[acyl-carrier-protein] reductase (NADH)
MVEKAAQGTPEKRVVQADEVAQTVMAAVTHMTATTGTVLLVEAGSLL